MDFQVFLAIWGILGYFEIFWGILGYFRYYLAGTSKVEKRAHRQDNDGERRQKRKQTRRLRVENKAMHGRRLHDVAVLMRICINL